MIANELGVHKSTIFREIKRKQGLRGYRPQQAQKLSDERKQNPKKQNTICQIHYCTKN